MAASETRVLGMDVPPSSFSPVRSVIGEVTDSMSGNVVIRVGRTVRSGGWTQTEHVVLTQHEAEDLMCRLAELIRS